MGFRQKAMGQNITRKGESLCQEVMERDHGREHGGRGTGEERVRAEHRAREWGRRRADGATSRSETDAPPWWWGDYPDLIVIYHNHPPVIADLSSVHPFPVKFFKALSLNLFSRCGDFDDICHAPEFLCVAHYSWCTAIIIGKMCSEKWQDKYSHPEWCDISLVLQRRE